MLQKIIILGTGGTIAGWADDPAQPQRYEAGRVGVDQLLQALPEPMAHAALGLEQIAQIDSKDMDDALWRRLLQRLMHHLSDPEVGGVVITHGTDTMEETAFLLAALLPCDKPVVLTGAMRAANAPDADGPRNLADAILAAQQLPGGVWVVFAGQVHHGAHLQKIRADTLDPYASDPFPVAGTMADLQRMNAWVAKRATGPWPLWTQVCDRPWPRVELLYSHANAKAWWLDALLHPAPGQAAVQGLVLAGTGQGTWPKAWAQALNQLKAQGVRIWLTSRCALARLPSGTREGWETVPWTPVQARVALMLRLLT